MTFILYRNGTCLTKIYKLWFHNNFEILENEIENSNVMSKIFFSFFLDKTHFLPSLFSKSPNLYLLKRHLIADSLSPWFFWKNVITRLTEQRTCYHFEFRVGKKMNFNDLPYISVYQVVKQTVFVEKCISYSGSQSI